MPVNYAIDGQLLKIICYNTYTPQDLKDTLTNALSDPKCPTKASFLLDVSNSRSLAKRSPGQIYDAARFLIYHSKKLSNRCAILVKSEIQFGLSRMGSAYLENYGINAGVFRQLDEALMWLGIHESQEHADKGTA